MAKQVEYTPSSGNVFADLGLANADEHLARAQEAVKIALSLESSKLTKKRRTGRNKVRSGIRSRQRTNRA